MHTKFLGYAPFIEVQRSLVVIGGAATVRNKEMVENVHDNRFLKLFLDSLFRYLPDIFVMKSSYLTIWGDPNIIL